MLATDRSGFRVFVVILGDQLSQESVVSRRFERSLFNVRLCVQFTHQADDFFTDPKTELKCVQHFQFRNFAAKTFDHGDRFFGRRNDDIHVAVFQLIVSWEGNEFTINASHSARRNRLFKRHWRDKASHGRAVHCQHITISLLITGKHKVLTLDFIFEAFSEHWANRTVN